MSDTDINMLNSEVFGNKQQAVLCVGGGLNSRREELELVLYLNMQDTPWGMQRPCLDATTHRTSQATNTHACIEPKTKHEVIRLKPTLAA
jgi:hypothetical protein